MPALLRSNAMQFRMQVDMVNALNTIGSWVKDRATRLTSGAVLAYSNKREKVR